jgi:predicted nucleotidyltransferase component of viral defense system
MPRSPEFFRSLANGSGYRLESLEKVIRLGELLAELDGEADLNEKLALRGGTALNLEQSSPPRLSVDIDLDYVGFVDRNAMVADKCEVIASVRRIAVDLGYRIQERDEHAGTSITLIYQNAAGTSDYVKIDISWTNRVGIEPRRRVRLWQPGGLDLVEFTLVGRADLIAGKFRALIDRIAARDVFDAVRISERLGAAWPPPEVKAAFIFLTGTLSLPLTAYGLERLDRLTPEDFEKNLLPMLDPNIQLTREELIEQAKMALEPLLNFSAHESDFIESLDQGHLKPELLFAADDAERLAQHPHLSWKAQNRRDHLNKKP